MTTTAQIRQILNMAFDDSELSAFCLDYFPDVYDRFSQGMRKDDKITWLLDHCRRHPTAFDTLRNNLPAEYTLPEKPQVPPPISPVKEAKETINIKESHLTKASFSPVIRQLAEHLTQQRLALFIGADLPSSVTGLPSRAELAQGLAQREGLDEGLTLAKITQRMMRGNNRWNFTQYIKKQLETSNKAPQRFHQLLIELPVEMMITTAYDDLLRRAFDQSGLVINHLVRNSDFPFVNPQWRSLLKLYGDLSQLDSLIITEDDHYGLWRHRDKENLLDEVRRISRRQALLFLGYNLASPDFNLLWREVLDRMGNFAIGAYAIWPNFPPDEQQVWQNRQIKLIDAEPVALLEALLAAVKA